MERSKTLSHAELKKKRTTRKKTIDKEGKCTQIFDHKVALTH